MARRLIGRIACGWGEIEAGRGHVNAFRPELMNLLNNVCKIGFCLFHLQFFHHLFCDCVWCVVCEIHREGHRFVFTFHENLASELHDGGVGMTVNHQSRRVGRATFDGNTDSLTHTNSMFAVMRAVVCQTDSGRRRRNGDNRTIVRWCCISGFRSGQHDGAPGPALLRRRRWVRRYGQRSKAGTTSAGICDIMRVRFDFGRRGGGSRGWRGVR